MTKRTRIIYRSSEPAVELLSADPHRVAIPGCEYTWDQLAEMRAALGEHLQSIEQFPLADPTRTDRRARTIFFDRTGKRELGYITGGRLTISAYSLSIEEAQDFYRLLNALLEGQDSECAPDTPPAKPTPVCFHNLCKIPA